MNDCIQVSPICRPLEMRQAGGIVCSLNMIVIIIIILIAENEKLSTAKNHDNFKAELFSLIITISPKSAMEGCQF